MELSVLLLILIPVVTAFLIPLIDIIYKKMRKVIVVISISGELLLTLLFIIYKYNSFINGNLSLKYYLGGWSSVLGITLQMDNIAFLFSSLICF